METQISQESLLYYINNHYEIKGSSKPVLGMPDIDAFKSNASELTLSQQFCRLVVALNIVFPIFPVYPFLS